MNGSEDADARPLIKGSIFGRLGHPHVDDRQGQRIRALGRVRGGNLARSLNGLGQQDFGTHSLQHGLDHLLPFELVIDDQYDGLSLKFCH
jgi:hypothetical protein